MFVFLGVLGLRAAQDVVGKNIQVYLERSYGNGNRIEKPGFEQLGKLLRC